MRRFFINSRAIDDDEIVLEGSDVHHISRVLRLGPGDRITLIDESATEYDVEIANFIEDKISCNVIVARQPPVNRIKVALFQGLPKGTKFDEIIEKATELGADSITPVVMERCVARPDAAAGGRVQRWRRIGEAAAKQSRRPTMPRIDAPLAWNKFVESLAEFDRIVVFWEGAVEPVDQALADFTGSNLAVVIGPEGGLTAAEVVALTDARALTAWLGPRILRTETAPLAALAIINFLLKR